MFDDEGTQSTEEKVEEDKDDKPTRDETEKLYRFNLEFAIGQQGVCLEITYDACEYIVELGSVDVSLLIERMYPLSAEVAKLCGQETYEENR
ncbi:hypothetical protein Tco_0619871 [Tanacetum coccineum]